MVAWPSGKAEACKASIPSSNLGATFSYHTKQLMLYLVSTPIGNLKDITFRAVEILQNCDYILCEDTRHSQILLKHYNIHKPLISYHQFSEAEKEEHIIEDLRAGKAIALISDAGTPGISDPGSRIVKKCREENLNVTAIPGPCAAIAALSCSGLDTDLFQFYGFLPRKANQLKTTLIEILQYPGTSICYESPNRILDVLEQIKQLAPNRKISVARELTKHFEEIKLGTAEELLEFWRNHPLKGEIVLLIEGNKESPDNSSWSQLTPEEHVAELEKTYHLTRNEAIKMAAQARGIPKRELYSKFHK